MSFSHNHAFLFTNILGVHALLERAKNILIVYFVLLKKLHGIGSARLKVSWIVHKGPCAIQGVAFLLRYCWDNLRDDVFVAGTRWKLEQSCVVWRRRRRCYVIETFYRRKDFVWRFLRK